MQLNYDGTVIFAPSPAGPDQPALRRAQALAAGDEIGLTVTREILRVKLKGQGEVAGLLGSEETAGLIVRLAGEIAGVGDSAQILAIEATAAVAHWALWRDLPAQFARHSEVPEHWRTFGPRSSPLTGRLLRAATPGNALLNYLYRALESEMVIALRGVGLDPGIAIFHLDRERRSSLALDAIEAVRPYVDFWLAAWLAALPLCKARLCRVAGWGDPHHAPADEPPSDERSDLAASRCRSLRLARTELRKSCRRRRSAHRWDYLGSAGPACGSYAQRAASVTICRRRCQGSSRAAARIARPPSRMTRSPELATNAVGCFQFVPTNSALR